MPNIVLPNSHTYRFGHRFVRCQGPGGCFIYATLTIMDILYQQLFVNSGWAPSLSVAFAEYFYNSNRLYNPQNKKYDRRNPYKGNHFRVLKHLGCCSESSMPTNYDRGKSDPTPHQISEALNYRVADWGNKLRPKANQMDNDFLYKIKYYLYTIGPVYASVWLGPHKTNDESHAVAIIGYDDSKSEFEYANSQGDTDWSVNPPVRHDGIGTISYSAFLGSNMFPQIILVQWVKVKPPEKMDFPTALIVISTDSPNIGYGRNALSVRLGMVGSNRELIVWDRNNSYVGKGIGIVKINKEGMSYNMAKIFDTSANLTIKVPLPYNYRPGNYVKHPWYLKIENHSVKIPNNFQASVNAKLLGFMLWDIDGTQRFCASPLPITISPEQEIEALINL